MKRVAIVTYNRNANFTNYGSALQTYALSKSVERVCDGAVEVVCLNYCPRPLEGVNALDPVRLMWDSDEDSRRMVELSMPAIRENYIKFEHFYDDSCRFSARAYTADNVGESWEDESLSGYVCGSDTIFCIREFGGFDPAYYSDAPHMRGRAVAYAASFGDVDWTAGELGVLTKKLRNFRAIGLRESLMVAFCRRCTEVPVARVVDPTLLLCREDYLEMAVQRQHEGSYVLLYSRRYDPVMEDYAKRTARELGCDVVEISLRATNAEIGHDMRYDAGVEEFLALVRDAEYVVTNSYHGLAFAMQMRRPFTVFAREGAESKISELLDWVGLADRKATAADCDVPLDMDFRCMEEALVGLRTGSLSFLRQELDLLGVC